MNFATPLKRFFLCALIVSGVLFFFANANAETSISFGPNDILPSIERLVSGAISLLTQKTNSPLPGTNEDIDNTAFEENPSILGGHLCDITACEFFGQTCCSTSNACTSIINDENNCGGCGIQCGPGVDCISYSCNGCNETNCNAFGAICCAGINTCVDWTTDENNCGGCGINCAARETCTGGTCVAPSCDPVACGVYGSICCSGTTSCIDWTTDENNCGGCGITCAPGDTCVYDSVTSTASCSPPACDPVACGVYGSICCPGSLACIDWTTDENNCGTCGNVCPLGVSCVYDPGIPAAGCGGVCDPVTCGAVGAICCPGSSGCINWTDDESNCGGCGITCGVGEQCIYDPVTVTASCQVACDPAACSIYGAICCPGITGCVDWTSDEDNCGGCGVSCVLGEQCVYDPVTTSASCQAICDPDACGAYGAICCSGTTGCVDWTTDENNCGGCGIQCGVNQTCNFDPVTSTASCGICGRGTTEAAGTGPVFEGVNSCKRCENIVQCIEQKTGRGDVAFLWDDVTEKCGVGLEVTPAIEDAATSCFISTGTCSTLDLGDVVASFDLNRFNEVRILAIEMAQKSASILGKPVRPEFMMAVMLAESSWTLNPGGSPDPINFVLPNDYNIFLGPNLCGNPTINGETIADFSIPCANMNVSQNPVGYTHSAGAMGMAQFIPSTWVGYSSRTKQLTGRTIANPYNERDAVAANAVYLGQLMADCGSEEAAAGAYYTGSCTSGTSYWLDHVKPRLDEIEPIFDGECVGPVDSCPIVMAPYSGPTSGCVTLNSDFCPGGGCACYFGGTKPHTGVDLNVYSGEPLYAVDNGVIENTNTGCVVGDGGCGGTGYGNYVVLRGSGGQWYLYAHMEDVLVTPGDTVSKGQVIGHADNTGRSTGTHLHFEVSSTGNPIAGATRIDPRDAFNCIPDTCGSSICIL